jgi:hypothetical protein
MSESISETVITPVFPGIFPMIDSIVSALNRCMTTSAADEDLNV